MATFANQSKSSTTFTNGDREGFALWGDAFVTWGDALFTWGGNATSWSNNTKSSTSFTGVTKN